jgi:nucleotide-binding universal stress UspA family protein
MFNLLFATDFDKDAPKMFEYTSLLAHTFGSKIKMFHAFGNGAMFTEKEFAKRGAEVMEELKNFVHEHQPIIHQGVKIEYIVDKDFAFDAIPRVAEDENIDVVVLGVKDSHRYLGEYLGSTTFDIMTKLGCAVLAFPEGFTTNRINDLGCTTDFEFRDIALINMLREMGKKLDKDANIHCLHVFEDSHETEARVKKDIEVLYSVFDGRKGTKVNFEIQSGNLEDTIEAFAKDKEFDLMVMNSHQRNFFGRLLERSTTKSVARDIKVPLLILKDL